MGERVDPLCLVKPGMRPRGQGLRRNACPGSCRKYRQSMVSTHAIAIDNGMALLKIGLQAHPLSWSIN